VVITQAILPWKSKYYQTVAYGKMCTAEIDIQHAKLLHVTTCKIGILPMHYFLEFTKTPPFTLKTAVVFHLKQVVC